MAGNGADNPDGRADGGAFALVTVERAALAPAGLEADGAQCVARYLASLAPSGRASQAARLRLVARLLGAADPFVLPWHAWTAEVTLALRAMLARQYSPAAANATLGAVYRVLRLCERAGVVSNAGNLIDADADGRADYVKGGGPAEPCGRMLDTAELGQLYGAAARDTNANRGARDAAALALAHGAGLRRAEVTALHAADVDLDAGQVTVRRGKGNKTRTVDLPAGTVHYLRVWLELRGADPGPLFLAVNRGGRILPPAPGDCPFCGLAHLTTQALHGALAVRLAGRAGVRFMMHDTRRTFVSGLLDSGVDIATVAKMAGHSSVDMTRRYDRRGAEARKAAAASVFVPVFGAPAVAA